MSGLRSEADQSDTDELVKALRDVLAGRPVRNADELIARYIDDASTRRRKSHD